jgi:hypothetical protein
MQERPCRFVPSFLFVLTAVACAGERAEQSDQAEPKERAVPVAATSEAEEAALLAQHLPPELFGDPKVSQAEKVQQSIDKQLNMIRAAGEGDELKSHAEALAKAWSKLGQAAAAKFTVQAPECFKAGCSVVTVHSSDRDLELISSDLTHTEPFHRWNAGKFRGGYQPLESGEIKLTWVFHAPPPGAAVMQPEDNYKNFDENLSVLGKSKLQSAE